jgi:transcriptional regulator with XRE-family HTH domain
MGTKDDRLARLFAGRLRELRTAAGLTQAELGEKVDPSMQLQAVARYESGTRVPTLAILYRLAKALGCKPCDLLPGGELLPENPTRKGKK